MDAAPARVHREGRAARAAPAFCRSFRSGVLPLVPFRAPAACSVVLPGLDPGIQAAPGPLLRFWIAGSSPLLSGLIFWTGCTVLILLVFRRWRVFRTRQGATPCGITIAFSTMS